MNARRLILGEPPVSSRPPSSLRRAVLVELRDLRPRAWSISAARGRVGRRRSRIGRPARPAARLGPVTGETSLYRRHRPQAFDQVVGQEHVVRTLRTRSSATASTTPTCSSARAGPARPRWRRSSPARSTASTARPLTPCGKCESCVDDRRRHLARRDRDGRRLEPLGRRHPRPARAGRLRAGRRALEGLHPRRGPHAHPRGLERVPEDARGAAAEHRLHPRHHRAAQGDGDDRRPLPALRLPAPLARADRRGDPPRRGGRGDRDRRRRGRRDRPRRRRAASATRSARSTSSSPTAASR